MLTPYRFYPVLDDFGVVRVLSVIKKGETFTGHKQGFTVAKAMAEVLGEEVHDWSKAPPAAVAAEVARLNKLSANRPKPTTVGLYVVIGTSGAPLAFINAFKEFEEECSQIANQVAVRLSAFYKVPLYPELVEINLAFKRFNFKKETNDYSGT